jgi:4-hydroxy-tetrahydrodipicolinate synthase
MRTVTDQGLGAVLTAIVTPFDDELNVDEEAFVDLMRHLAAHGSDGFVVCGTTGEASTLTDEEHLRVIELAVQERPSGATIIAGTGSNNTRHAVHLTERSTELGADAVLSVTPYYNRPNRRGILAHFGEVARATDKPVVLYNVPSRVVIDLPNDLLAELAQLDNVSYLKQANNANLAQVDGLVCTRATTTPSSTPWSSAGAAASWSPATWWASRCAGWSTSPSTGPRSTPRCGTCTPRWASPPTPSR